MAFEEKPSDLTAKAEARAKEKLLARRPDGRSWNQLTLFEQSQLLHEARTEIRHESESRR